MATCNVGDLMRDGACFCAVTGDPFEKVRLQLLCEWAGGDVPPPVWTGPTWAPDTVISNWSDGGGNHSGNLSAFKASVDLTTLNDLLLNGTAITAFDSGSQVSMTGQLSLSNCANLSSIGLPNLVSIGGTFAINQNPSLAAFSALVLHDVDDFTCASCAILASVDVRNLVTSNNNFDASLCPALVSVRWDSFLPTDGQTFDFGGDALNATSVDLILHRGVVAGNVASTIELNGGTNSPPTGGNLNADYVTLTTAGCTVDIN